MDQSKVEQLKVWYALFTVIIDDTSLEPSEQIRKLEILRNEMREETGI